MAMGVLKKQAESLGVTEETLEAKHLPLLAENIKKGLSIFIGADKAMLISSVIRDLK
jgi:hypothetical protein